MLWTTMRGVYVQTGVMQTGRPVYEISGPETAYLYFSDGAWNIGPSYSDGPGWFYSSGAGADAPCPADVPTWETLPGADGITVVNGTDHWDEATGATWSIVGAGRFCSGDSKHLNDLETGMSVSQCQAAVLGDPDCGIYMTFNDNGYWYNLYDGGDLTLNDVNDKSYCGCTLDRVNCGMQESVTGSSVYMVQGGTCRGDAATWHSGSGPCSWYAPGHSSGLFDFCHEDGNENGGVNDGMAAIHVCSECGACTEPAPTLAPTPAPLEVEDSAAPRAGGAGTLLAAFVALLLTGGGALGTGP